MARLVFFILSPQRCKVVQSDAKCGELYGTIFGTFLVFSAPLAAPFYLECFELT
jgi:hypothetical protein